MARTIYTAVFFGYLGMEKHMTISFRPSEDEIDATPFGAHVAVRKVGEIATDEFSAVAVEPLSDEIPEVKSGQPHITFSTFGDFKPGDIASRMIEDPSIINPARPDIFIGRIGRFMSDGSVQFE